MGNLEIGGVDVIIVVEKNIDIDRTIAIGPSLMTTPQFPLDLLRDTQQFTRRERGLTENHRIEELIARRESPGTGLDDGRLTKHLTHPFTNERYGTRELCLTITLITAQAKVGLMFLRILHHFFV